MVYAPQILTSSIIWLVVLILILPFCIFLGRRNERFRIINAGYKAINSMVIIWFQN